MGVSSGMYLGTEPRIDQETAKIHALFLDYDLTFISLESATENMFTFHDRLLVDRRGGLYDNCDDDADGEEGKI